MTKLLGALVARGVAVQASHSLRQGDRDASLKEDRMRFKAMPALQEAGILPRMRVLAHQWLMEMGNTPT